MNNSAKLNWYIIKRQVAYYLRLSLKPLLQKIKLLDLAKNLLIIVKLAKRPKAIEVYLKNNPIKKLNIGAGGSGIEGWFNTDVAVLHDTYFLNATKPFPFTGEVFDYIYSEHMIEHINYKEGLFMLRECYRVLKIGGKIRVATPNLEFMASLYSKEKTETQAEYIKSIIDIHCKKLAVGINNEGFVVNNNFYNFGHKFIYDYSTLSHALEQAGFANIKRYQPSESDDKNFLNIDGHMDTYIRFETLVLEAEKN